MPSLASWNSRDQGTEIFLRDRGKLDLDVPSLQFLIKLDKFGVGNFSSYSAASVRLNPFNNPISIFSLIRVRLMAHHQVHGEPGIQDHLGFLSPCFLHQTTQASCCFVPHPLKIFQKVCLCPIQATPAQTVSYTRYSIETLGQTTHLGVWIWIFGHDIYTMFLEIIPWSSQKQYAHEPAIASHGVCCWPLTPCYQERQVRLTNYLSLCAHYSLRPLTRLKL